MTQEQQDKLRKALYNAKFTTDAEDENPFVGIYFNNLLDIIHDFGQQHPNWIPVDRELPKKDGRYLFYDEELGPEVSSYYKGVTLMPTITHWAPKPQPPQWKEE